jgi:hypothetical protein
VARAARTSQSSDRKRDPAAAGRQRALPGGVSQRRRGRREWGVAAALDFRAPPESLQGATRGLFLERERC